LDISIRSGDICDRSLKLSKLTLTLHVLAPDFFGGTPPNFGILIITLNVLPIRQESFTAIVRGNSEISRWKQRKEQKHQQ